MKIQESEYTKLEKKIRRLLIYLKPHIADDYRATDYPEDGTPGMCVTVGATPEDDGTLSWGYQTGDNSFTGGAYGHRHWGIGYLYRRSNCASVASDMVNEISESIAQMENVNAGCDRCGTHDRMPGSRLCADCAKDE